MFAGAAREAVFASPEVVRRINADFIPVALKAGLVNNPPGGLEGELYAELNRTKAAPQGICVANSAGKPLAWALSFDDDDSIVKFLDYTQRRFRESPNAAQPVVTERFMRFPSNRMADVVDRGRTLVAPDGHNSADRCPALPAVERGTLIGRIIGRPLDDAGLPVARTLRQEDYMEARCEIPPGLQRQLTAALAAARAGEPFALPTNFARAVISHAYLGQLDVNPLGGRLTGGRTDRESLQFQARRVRDTEAGQLLYVTGSSQVAGGPAEIGVRTDGRQWEHVVQLTWEGYLEVSGDYLTRLVMLAEGTERLRWGSERWQLNTEPDVAHLMAGHPIDFAGRVRYGLTAEPCEEEHVATLADAAVAPQPRPEDLPPQVILQIRRLRELGQNEQADRLERAARVRAADLRPGPPIEQRIEHLREAVKHLRAAGFDDVADQVARQLQQIEQVRARRNDQPER